MTQEPEFRDVYRVWLASLPPRTRARLLRFERERIAAKQQAQKDKQHG